MADEQKEKTLYEQVMAILSLTDVQPEAKAQLKALLEEPPLAE